MKIKLRLSAIFLAIAILFPLKSHAFSAVAPSGQTLYYTIISGYNVAVDGHGADFLSNLTGALVIPSSVTPEGSTHTYTVTAIPNEAFRNNITINSNGDTIIGCPGLTSVSIPNTVTYIGDYAFAGNINMTSVSIPNSVTSIGYAAFSGCHSLLSINIPNSVTFIGESAFSGCRSLSYVNIPASITRINDGMFYNCTGLESVSIPNTVTSIGDGVFEGCASLSSVNIPNSVDSIGSYAFSGCSSLPSITIPSSVTYIGDIAFYNCTSLATVNYNATNCTYCGGIFVPDEFINIFSGCTAPATLNIGSNVQYIQGGAFNSWPGLTTVNYYAENAQMGIWPPNGSYYSPFHECDAIASLNIMETVQSLSPCAFAGWSGLTSVNIYCSEIGYCTFSHCTSLSSVFMSNSVISIGYGAFMGCSSLQSVNIPNSVTSIGSGAFSSCSSLQSVNIPNSITSIGSGAFSSCSSLQSVHIPNSITSIESETFHNCTSLATVSIPNSVMSIDTWAFYNCSSLTSLTIPNSVTNIGGYAFEECSSLTSLTIPNSVTDIGEAAFYDCGSITEIFSLNPTPPILEGFVFYGVPNDIPVYVPCGSVVAYQTSWTDFSNFENIIYSVLVSTNSNNQDMGYVDVSYSCDIPHATLTAVANPGYHFLRWNDDVTENPREVVVSHDTLFIAYFAENNGGQLSDNAPSIACVGVNQNGYNVVRWEPRQETSPVRYNIYRDGLGGFTNVGSVNATDAEDYSWVDDNSNTATQAYSYKISEVTANGTESDLSSPHTTIHLQISQGQGATWNLSWTPYVGFNYSSYLIYRGTTASSMSLLTELSSSATTYSDNNAPSGDVYYQIEVIASNSAKSITASSRSNIATSVQNQQFTITVLSDNTLMGTVSGGGTFAQGSTATIVATALDGYTFTQWSDGSTQAQRTITVMGNATYTAYFDGSNGIPNVETADDLRIYTRGNTIVIDFSGRQAEYSRQSVIVYDVMGRVVKQTAGSGQQAAVEIPVTSAGVYMVKVGERPSRKVIVRP